MVVARTVHLSITFLNMPFYSGDPDDKHQRGVENRPLRKRTCQETRDEIARYLQAEADINATSLNQITFPMITVQCEMIKNQLISKAQDMSKSLINGFLSEVQVGVSNDLLSLTVCLRFGR